MIIELNETYSATISEYGEIKIYRHGEECVGYQVDNVLSAAIYTISTLLDETN